MSKTVNLFSEILVTGSNPDNITPVPCLYWGQIQSMGSDQYGIRLDGIIFVHSLYLQGEKQANRWKHVHGFSHASPHCLVKRQPHHYKRKMLIKKKNNTKSYKDKSMSVFHKITQTKSGTF